MTRELAALDLETWLIEDGVLAPPVVCASVALFEGRSPVGTLVAPGQTREEKVRGVVSVAGELLEDDGYDVAGANVVFDLGCLVREEPRLVTPIFKAYERGRVHDVQISQALHAIACGDLGVDPRTHVPFVKSARQEGRYSLERCVAFVLGRQDAKVNDEWRRAYALLGDVPVEDWPERARVYPVDDVVNTLEVAASQRGGGGLGVTPGPHRNQGDLCAQCETAWAMHLGAMWGIRADGEAVRELRARVERDHAEFVRRHARFFKSNGKVDKVAVKRAVAVAYAGPLEPCDAPGCVGGKTLSEKTGNPVLCGACAGTGLDLPPAVPRTPAGGVQADQDTLASSGDPDLEAFGENAPEKIRETYLPWLESGTRRPLTFRPNVLVASGRTSYDGLVQLLPREGGVRECLAARPGHVLCSVDYAAIELVTLSQACLWTIGRSHMAEVIRETGDPGMLHTTFGARLAGWSVEEMVRRLAEDDKVAKNMRWAAKACNFGKPGGMGAAKFTLTQRKRSAGRTVSPDGEVVYPGLRFCILLGDARRCGEDSVTEWRGRDVPRTCRRCLEIVERDLNPGWLRQWPEIRPYHEWVSRTVDAGGEFPCLVPGPGGAPRPARVRGGLDFTNGANNCVDYETEVMTRRGWLTCDELRLDDLVMTKDAASGALEWQAPTAINRYPDYAGPLFEFDSEDVSAVTTPAHRWLVCAGSGEDVCVTSLDMALAYKTTDRGGYAVHRAGTYAGEGDAALGDGLLRLVGRFAVDGRQHTPELAASLPRRQAEAASRGLTPELAASLSRRQAEVTLQTMLLGDAARSKSPPMARETADALQILATLTGRSSRVEWQRDASAWVVHLSGGEPSWVSERHVKAASTRARPRARGVWCPSVPNGYFVARRCGKVYVTGNSFQALAADGAKAAYRALVRECYTGERTEYLSADVDDWRVVRGPPRDSEVWVSGPSPLLGARPLLFVHDEVVSELELVGGEPHGADRAARRQAEVMVQVMQRYVPDVPVRASPELMYRWSKGAKARYDAEGRLVPCDER